MLGFDVYFTQEYMNVEKPNVERIQRSVILTILSMTFFFKVCHHPGGFIFIYLAHVTTLTCKGNVQSTNASHT